MANYRQSRINDQMAKELAEILRTVKDYRVASAFVSVTAVDCTKDLKYAKVYFSTIGKDADPETVRKGLVSATGYIRTALARQLNLRVTPELSFHYDQSVAHGARIAELLHEAGADRFAEEDASKETGEEKEQSDD